MTVAENIFTEKYGLTRTHSEVLYSAKSLSRVIRSISGVVMGVTVSGLPPTVTM